MKIVSAIISLLWLAFFVAVLLVCLQFFGEGKMKPSTWFQKDVEETEAADQAFSIDGTLLIDIEDLN